MSSNLRVQELDFDTIKQNLKDFLRGKPEFSDYDFEGSGINALLNVLAYNDHYLAVLANLQMQELFLDTASKRTTAALHASRLGYIPGSKKSPIAKVTLEIFPNDTPSTLTIGRGATFETTIFGVTYQFVTTEAKTVPRNGGRYVFDNLEIREGSYKTYRYLTVEGTENKFMIPSKNIDISTLIVKVQVSASNSNFTRYQLNTSIADLDAESPAYFLRLNSDGFYEVYFGDGIISKTWTPGNVIVLEYIETNGSATNGAAVFSFTDSVQGYSSNLVTVTQAASGGSEEETVEEIKVNAQAVVGTQNRAVTTNDFYSAIKDIYPVESLAVWGGEQNIPKIYGKVFIAIKPKGNAEILTQNTKQYIVSALIKRKNIVTVTPVIVDPDYVYVGINSTVYYLDTTTEYSASTIETLVKETIMNYADTNLGKFNSALRHSKLSSLIDDTDNSIVSNITKITLRKSIPVQYLSTSSYTIDFGNPFLASNSENINLTSTGFYVLGNENLMRFDDNNGILRIYYMDGTVKKVYSQNAGTVDYDTGRITFTNLNITSAESSTVEITVIPSSCDVLAIRENILVLESDDVLVTPIIEQIDLTKHVFTPSR